MGKPTRSCVTSLEPVPCRPQWQGLGWPGWLCRPDVHAWLATGPSPAWTGLAGPYILTVFPPAAATPASEA